MKIYIACSKHFYKRIEEIKEELEKRGHKISLPNSYEEPFKEEKIKLSREEHIEWKSKMIRKNKKNIEPNDAILILNFKKKGKENYIGGATFLEMYKAWELSKKIFLYNPIPENDFKDEIIGINPTIINGDLDKIE